jgi:hypothetical protein
VLRHQRLLQVRPCHRRRPIHARSLALVRVGWGFGRALRRFDFSPLRTRTDAARFLCSPLQGGAAPDVHDP